MEGLEGHQAPGREASDPGFVSHATNLLEHPEVVADRIIRFAQVVGRENIIAGTDCGLGGRVHPQIAWAQLAVLAEGAKLATRGTLAMKCHYLSPRDSCIIKRDE